MTPPVTTSLPWSGVVPLGRRGSLPFAVLHQRQLYLHALLALAAVIPRPVLLADADPALRQQIDLPELPLGTRVLSPEVWWAERKPGPVLVHDPLCPLTPVSVLADAVARVEADPDCSIATYRPVTDTVKTAVDDRIEGTIDRERLGIVTSPVAIHQALVDGLPQPPHLDDLGRLVGWIRGRGRLELVKAPSVARRVDDESAVHLLECLDEMSRQLRHPLSDAPATRTPAGT
jgi:hypothetical protein